MENGKPVQTLFSTEWTRPLNDSKTLTLQHVEVLSGQWTNLARRPNNRLSPTHSFQRHRRGHKASWASGRHGRGCGSEIHKRRREEEESVGKKKRLACVGDGIEEERKREENWRRRTMEKWVSLRLRAGRRQLS
jgi:hypothetical protein